MNKSHLIHTALRCGIACTLVLLLNGCGRADVPTSAAEPTVLDVDAAQPLPPGTSVAYPIAPPTEIELPEPTAIILPAPVLGVVIDEQDQVLYVEPNGAADKAGVQAGDTLIALDDMVLANEKEKIKKHVSDKEKDAEMTLTYKRDGKEKKVKVKSDLPPIPPPEKHIGTPTPVYAPNDYL